MNKNLRGIGRVYRRTRKDRKTRKRKESKIWWVQFYHQGHQVRKSSGTTNRSQAVKFLKKQIEASQAGKLVIGEGERLKFEGFADLVVRDYQRNQRRSLDRAQRAIKRLKAFFGGFRPIVITKAMIDQYVDYRLNNDKAANATVKYELSLLKRMFRLSSNMLGRSPEFPIIHVNNVRTGFFEEKDFRVVAEHLDEDTRAPVTFAYLTGWRMKSEVFTLRWSQVDFRVGEVRLEPGTTKTDEGRTFPFALLPELAALLQAQREKTEQLQRSTGMIIPWVFHRRGHRIKDVRGAWWAAIDAAKIGDRIPHDFRRTAVRHLEWAGVPRSVAMQLVGHKTESIYRRYAIVAKNDLVDGMKRLAEYRAVLQEGQQNVVALERGVGQ
jgi:integrase